MCREHTCTPTQMHRHPKLRHWQVLHIQCYHIYWPFLCTVTKQPCWLSKWTWYTVMEPTTFHPKIINQESIRDSKVLHLFQMYKGLELSCKLFENILQKKNHCNFSSLVFLSFVKKVVFTGLYKNTKSQTMQILFGSG